jgi:D-glycero-alpha-D-manno-heptose 1-phosphate guanylyltransferase
MTPLPKAVVLLGGKGTRIAAQFPDRPKALVPVCGRPFLEWQLDWLRANHIHRVLLAAGHMADVLQAYLDARPHDGLLIQLSREPSPLGTGGALAHVAPLLDSDPVLVLNGDSLLPNLLFSTLWKKFSTPWKNSGDFFHGMEKVFHSVEKSCHSVEKVFHSVEVPDFFFRAAADAFPGKALLFATPIRDPGRYGTVEFGSDGIVSAFREKAPRDAGFVNAGIYLLPRDVVHSIPRDRPVSIETEIFPALAAQRNLVALPAPPPLLDMGTPDGLAAMEHFFGNQRGQTDGGGG